MNQNLSIALAFAAGAVIAGVGLPALNLGTSSVNEDQVKAIVRQVIDEEPKLILDSVQKMQNQGRAQAQAEASKVLADEAVRQALFYNDKSPYAGPKDAKKVVVEFFDYNCPACKVQYTTLSQLLKEHKDVKVVFKEFPIFGPQSDKNAMIALAVNKIDRTKYVAFHEKMMTFQGRADETQALKFVKEIGLNVEEVKKEAASREVAQVLAMHRELGGKIKVQGTPTVIVGSEIVPHAVSMDDIRSKLKL